MDIAANFKELISVQLKPINDETFININSYFFNTVFYD